jgi:hypothetical protein
MTETSTCTCNRGKFKGVLERLAQGLTETSSRGKFKVVLEPLAQGLTKTSSRGKFKGVLERLAQDLTKTSSKGKFKGYLNDWHIRLGTLHGDSQKRQARLNERIRNRRVMPQFYYRPVY